MLAHEQPWSPLSVEDTATLFRQAPFNWWIAGGIAIELAVGGPIRPHSDIDVLVLRQDHLLTREWLSEWDCWVADPPGVLRQWQCEQPLDKSVHDIWCRQAMDDDWRVQIMLDESISDTWVSRRDPEVTASIDDITWKTESDICFLAPHIQLFYKAKHMREKDQIDFDAVIEADVPIDRTWLRSAISQCYGPQHPWLPRIQQ